MDNAIRLRLHDVGQSVLVVQCTLCRAFYTVEDNLAIRANPFEGLPWQWKDVAPGMPTLR